MRRFWTGLRYGNGLTRLYVIGIPVCILTGIGFVIASFCINNMWFFLLGVACVIAGIALILNYNIEESDVEPLTDEEETANETGVVADSREMPEPNTEKQSEEKRQEEKQQSKKKRRQQTKKQKKQKEKEVEIEVEKEAEDEEPIKKEDSLLQYDEKKIKQVFYKYKIRKDYKCIIIDAWKKKGIYQQPAYIWRQRSQIHILVLGDKTQDLTIPMNRLTILKYHKGVICQAKKEYMQFRKESPVKTVFSAYLPTYRQGVKDGHPVIYKNLFELGDGILLTNTSVRAILELLQPEFQVDDGVTRDVRYNGFLKEIYKQSILLQNQVIGVKDYQEAVNENLQKLAVSEASEREYESTLQALYQNKMITQEYIEYYRQYREQGRQEKGERR